MDNGSYEYSVEYVVIGDEQVGKSAIVFNFALHRSEVNNYQYIHNTGAERYDLITTIDNKRFKLIIWDTCGKRIFRSINQKKFRNTAVIVLVYDITSRKSFNNLESWLLEVNAKQQPGSQTTVMLLGNKIDLENKRVVKKEEGEAFARKRGLLFMETSAFNGINIQTAFTNAAEKIYTGILEGVIDIYKENGVQYGSIVRSSPSYNNQKSGYTIMFVVLTFIILMIIMAVFYFYFK